MTEHQDHVNDDNSEEAQGEVEMNMDERIKKEAGITGVIRSIANRWGDERGDLLFGMPQIVPAEPGWMQVLVEGDEVGVKDDDIFLSELPIVAWAIMPAIENEVPHGADLALPRFSHLRGMWDIYPVSFGCQSVPCELYMKDPAGRYWPHEKYPPTPMTKQEFLEYLKRKAENLAAEEALDELERQR